MNSKEGFTHDQKYREKGAWFVFNHRYDRNSCCIPCIYWTRGNY